LHTLLKPIQIAYSFDTSQGDQWDVVFLDLVKDSAREGGSLGFISQINRLNVALTRAKVGRIVVGKLDMTANVWKSSGVDALKYLIDSHMRQKWAVRITGNVLQKQLEIWPEDKFKEYRAVVMAFFKSEM